MNVSRRAALCGVCSVCAHPLLEDPPDVQYLKNTRRRCDQRACRRCLAGKPPMWSLALSQVCRDLLNRGISCVLSVAVQHLALTTVYRCPWKGGLCRIAIFLNARYSKKYLKLGGPTGMPIQVRDIVPRCFWESVGCEVVRRSCCSASWRGWKCKYCQTQHGVSIDDHAAELGIMGFACVPREWSPSVMGI